MAFSLSGFAQCGVRDLPDSTQKKILSKFLQLERCDSLQIVNESEITDLRSDKTILQNHNKALRVEVEEAEEKALKRTKLACITGGIGLIVGIISGSRIK